MNYELTDETITNTQGVTLHRIRALVRIPAPSAGSYADDSCDIEPGELGGFIESTFNLDGTGCAWVGDSAQVWGEARVSQHARVYGDAKVHERAMVTGHASVSAFAEVKGGSHISGMAEVRDHALVDGHSEVSGRASIRDHAVISDKSEVASNAIVRSSALVTNSSKVGDSSTIGGYAHVIGSDVRGNSTVNSDAVLYKASVHGQSSVRTGGRLAFVHVDGVRGIDSPAYRFNPVGISGMVYRIIITDEHLTAGCQTHTFQEWRDMTPARLRRMDRQRAINFYPGLMALMEGVLSNRESTDVENPFENLPKDLQPLFLPPQKEESDLDTGVNDFDLDLNSDPEFE